MYAFHPPCIIDHYSPFREFDCSFQLPAPFISEQSNKLKVDAIIFILNPKISEIEGKKLEDSKRQQYENWIWRTGIALDWKVIFVTDTSGYFAVVGS